MLQRFYFDRDLDQAALNALLRDARLQFISDLLRTSSILATDRRVWLKIDVRKQRNRSQHSTQDMYIITGSIEL